MKRGDLGKAALRDRHRHADIEQGGFTETADAC